MIPNRDNLLLSITKIIKERSSEINVVYRGGPSQHFYHRIIELRRSCPDVLSFLYDETCIEILYATLVSWDMNSRGAKMKDYSDFKSNLHENGAILEAVEFAHSDFTWTNRSAAIDLLSKLYDKLALMKTGGRLVSNSKCLHFIFPNLCPPMDRTNTLNKLYGSTGESKGRFIEVLNLSYDVIEQLENPKQYLDDKWNRSETKLVDNAIILM